MSNKAKAASKKNDGKPALVPKLRFPEFRDVLWIREAIRDFARLTTERAGNQKCVLLSITSGAGLVSQVEKFGRTIAGNQFKNYFTLRRNEFAYNKSATKDYPQGFIAMYLGHELAAVPSSMFTCFGVNSKRVVPEYLNYLFLGNLHGIWLKRYIEVSARAHGSLSVDNEALLSLPVPLPSGPKSRREQQKIAACLISVDTLIAAQARKVDELKIHKKGLLLQLFPREGETQPRLRFPKFKNARRWNVRNLGQVAENLDNRRVPITASEREAGSVPYYGASGIVDYVKGFIFNEELLCVSEDGANLVARTYPIAFPISGKTWVNNHAHVLRFENARTQKFVEIYLNSIKLDEFITGMAQPKLNKAMLDSIPIPHPIVPEQRRIADCLTTLDDLIAAHSQRLEVLKTHKKGLMHQLFPSPEEVES